MPPTIERTLEAEIRRVMEAIGHCLVIYQRIELQLKYLLPYTHHPSETPPDTLAQWRSLIDSKTTLGPLMGRLSECVQSSDPDGFTKYVGQLVEERNQFIHHFCRMPFGRLNSIEQCDAALIDLDARIRFALPLHETLTGMLEEFCDALVQLKLQNEADS
jgi:hypothetical protein